MKKVATLELFAMLYADGGKIRCNPARSFDYLRRAMATRSASGNDVRHENILRQSPHTADASRRQPSPNPKPTILSRADVRRVALDKAIDATKFAPLVDRSSTAAASRKVAISFGRRHVRRQTFVAEGMYCDVTSGLRKRRK